MEAPEKIYLIRNFSNSTSLNTTNDYRGKYLQEWYKSREKDADVEYIRTDVVIKKALEWLKKNRKNYSLNSLGEEYFIKDFINYIREE